MTDLTIITNHIPRLLIDAYDLTAAERADFDYIDWPAIDAGEASATFFRYRAQLYDVSELMLASGVGIAGWDGYHAHGFSSGVIVRHVPDDDDRIIVGRYYS